MLKMKTASTGKIVYLFLITFFLLQTSNALTICQCSTSSTELRFTNTKNTVQHYSIQKSGIPSTWTTITPMTFELQPGQTKVVVAFTNVNCDETEGDYLLTIKAVSEDDVITKTINTRVDSCHSISVEPSMNIYDTCVNNELIIPININNTGDYLEKINLTTSEGRLSTNTLILNQKDSQVISLIVKPSIIGVNSIIIKAKYSNGLSLGTVNINAFECNYFNASLSKNYINLCEDEEDTINIIIKNGNKTNTFYFNTTSYFIDLPNSVKLNPNEERIIKTTVYSGCVRELIKTNISVWADGARKINLPVILNLKDCYLPILSSNKENAIACSCENVSYQYTLFNPGNKTITYALTSSLGEIYNSNGNLINQVTLKPDESANLTITHTIPCSDSEDINVTLITTSIGSCSKTASKTIKLKVNSWSECESVKIKAPDMIPLTNETVTVPVSLMNIGIRPASYQLIISGTAMNNLLGLSKSFVTLNPGESETIELTFNPDNITGAFINVQAFSFDNLASDSTMITFGGYALTDYAINYLIIPAGAIALISILLFRGKIFNKHKITKSNAKEIKIKKAKIKQ